MKRIKLFFVAALIAIAPIKSMQTNPEILTWHLEVKPHNGLLIPIFTFHVNGKELGSVIANGHRNRAGITEYHCEFNYPQPITLSNPVYLRANVIPCYGVKLSDSDLSKISERYYHKAISNYTASTKPEHNKIAKELSKQINTPEVDQKKNAELQEFEKSMDISLNAHMRTQQEQNHDHFMDQLNYPILTTCNDADEIAALAKKYQQ